MVKGKLALKTLDSFADSVNIIMDYRDKLCDPFISRFDLNPLDAPNKYAVTQNSLLSPLDHTNKQYKLVTEKEASGKALVKTDVEID